MNTIGRGTTPTQTFDIPVPYSIIDDVNITYNQHALNKIVKGTSDVTITADGSSSTIITVGLTQQETMSLDAGYPVEIQIKVYAVNGDVCKSCVKTALVTETLNKTIFQQGENIENDN